MRGYWNGEILFSFYTHLGSFIFSWLCLSGTPAKKEIANSTAGGATRQGKRMERSELMAKQKVGTGKNRGRTDCRIKTITGTFKIHSSPTHTSRKDGFTRAAYSRHCHEIQNPLNFVNIFLRLIQS
jgi:hypothetical protein